jgi:hypothetical protein
LNSSIRPRRILKHPSPATRLRVARRFVVLGLLQGMIGGATYSHSSLRFLIPLCSMDVRRHPANSIVCLCDEYDVPVMLCARPGKCSAFAAGFEQQSAMLPAPCPRLHILRQGRQT